MCGPATAAWAKAGNSGISGTLIRCQAFTYVEQILRGCDASLADVVKVTCYLTDLAEWGEMNEAYLEIFGADTPARIAVGCASLLFDAKAEFDCIAYRG